MSLRPGIDIESAGSVPKHTARPFWLWPNLLGLDAPVVAIVWQAFLAQSFSLTLRAPAQVALGLTVWAIYLTDRLLDARTPSSIREAARHQFHREGKVPLSILLGVVLLIDVAVALFWLRSAVLHNGMFALGGVLVYLGFLHLRGIQLPKEILVAALFVIGVFLTARTNTETPDRLFFPALSFFSLCLGNLCLIDAWEQVEFHQTDRRSLLLLIRAGLFVLAVICFLQQARWFMAISISAALIILLDLFRKKVSYEARRTLVDAFLLTPLLFRS